MSIAVHSAGDFVTGAVEYGAQAAAKPVVEQIKGADSFLHSTVQAIATALPKNNTVLKVQHQLVSHLCACHLQWPLHSPVIVVVLFLHQYEVQQLIITQLVLAVHFCAE